MKFFFQQHKSACIFSILLLVVFAIFTIFFLISSKKKYLPVSSKKLSIHITGNHFINSTGQQIRLIGVNVIASTNCIYNKPVNSIISPIGADNPAALATWSINVVRITLNEDCWLGINNVPSPYSGSTYQTGIVNFVNQLHSYGIYTILTLHWNAPGTNLSASQQAMADADHAPAFWQSVANTFKNDPAVLFELYNEPNLAQYNTRTTNFWQCLRDGCTITQFFPSFPPKPMSLQWQSAGMQSLVNAVRATGATNVITLSGIGYASDLSQLLQYSPTDPQQQLAANFHSYEQQSPACTTQTCWDSVIAPLAQHIPIITSEIGENDCKSTYVNQYMKWADIHNISYSAWGWTNWQCNAYGLLSDWSGTPSTYGKVFYNHFQAISPASSEISISPTRQPDFVASSNKQYQVQFIPNVAYGPQANEYVDVCIPLGATGLRPGIINIHGGGWVGGDKTGQDGLCRTLASHGFVVYNMNYRLTPLYQWPDQIGDAQLAIRFMKSQASQLNLDANRICSYGDSAGGHLALLVNMFTTIHQSDVAGILANISPKVNCTVDQFGPTDLARLYNENSNVAINNISKLLDNQTPTGNPSIYQDASPINHITSKTGSILIIQGTKDATVLPDQSQELQQALKQAAIPVQFISYEGGHEYKGLSFSQFTGIRSEILSYLIDNLHP